MAVRILPAVLARSPAQLRRQWQLASEYTGPIHLDLADGSLTSQRTLGQKSLRTLSPRQPVEVHLMSRRPDQWLTPILRLRTTHVILHVELGAALRPYLALFRTHRIPVSLAINPATPIARLTPWVKVIRGIQVMGVVPGQFGARWHPQTVKRIAAIHRRWPRLPMSCDGGMRPSTVPGVKRAGATTVIVGSFLQTHADPDAAWHELQAAVRA